MRQGAYVGLDRRPHVHADLYGPAGAIHLGKDFVLDSGATISGIEVPNAVTLTVAGLRGVQGASGPVQQVFLMDGGDIRFDVSDQSGNLSEVSYQGPIAALGVNVLGADAFSVLGLKLTWDFNTQPETVTLSS